MDKVVRAIIFAASLVAASIFFSGGLYEIESVGGDRFGIVWRVNTLTGSVILCGLEDSGPVQKC